MLCSGCGKDIPSHGSVCPYCQRDKLKDQQLQTISMIFGIGLGFVGYLIFGFWGGIGGLFIGVCIAFAIIGDRTTSPPQVTVANESTTSFAGTPEVRLEKLKVLFQKGLIDETEHKIKRQEILDQL